MAIAVGSVSNTPLHGSRTNTTITAPTGIVNGNLLVAVLFVGHASALPLLAVTPPAGWTEETNSPSGIDDTDPYEVSVRVYHKVASGESGDYTFTHAAAETQGYMYRLTGADTSTPIDATPVATQYTSPNGQTTTYGSVTTVTNGCFLIFAECDWDGPGSGTVSGTTPSIALRRAGTVTWLGDGSQTTAGATGSRTRTNGNSSTFGRWASIVVPIRPAGVGGSTTPQAVSATSASSIAIVKRAGKVVSTASSDVTTVTKRAGKGLSAVSATTALANATRAFLKTVAATVSSSAAITRQARKVVSASSVASVATRKAIAHSIAVLSPGAVTVTKRATKSFSAGCAASASVIKSVGKRLAAALSLAAALDYVVNTVLRVITPSPIEGRRIAYIGHENRLAETAPDRTRIAQASSETRAATVPEENRSVSAQPNSRTITP